MCGIAGHLAIAPDAPGNGFVVERMCAQLVHRGPDDSGHMVDGPVSLGHRRLSIIDLSPQAAQPMFNEDATVGLIINGEIYNFQDLRSELESRGHQFRSRSDSEVVLHLYEERGVDCLRDLRGMFALALWDQKTKTLVLARDPAGKKPVYYHFGKQGLVFASEMRALVASDMFPREPDLDALDAYLALQYVPSPMSCFRGVGKLQPGHRMVCRPGVEPVQEHYHELSYQVPESGPVEDPVRALREHLEEAVRIRLVSDVPLGAFLSGGVDSSLVVALMAGMTEQPVKTFSVGFPAKDHSELEYARMVAERYNTDHHEMVVEPDMVSIVPKIVRHYGEPFADASAVPTWYLSEYTRQFVTVALSGDGGDEGFAGYNRYLYARIARLLRRLPAPLPNAVSTLLSRLPFESAEPIRNFGRRLMREEVVRYLGWVAHFPHDERLSIYHPDMKARFAVDRIAGRFSEILEQSTASDPVGRLLDLDTRTYLPDDILVKVDIASMAHSLEVRAPLLDKEVMRFTASLPSGDKMRGFKTKVILRKAVGHLVPEAILSRPKQGFGLPIDRWMREDLAPMARDLLLDEKARSRGLFEPRAVEGLLESHADGQPRGLQIWNLLMLENWFRTFVDQSPV